MSPALKGGGQMRFCGTDLRKMIEELSPGAISLINKLGFDPCLTLSLDSLCNRSLVIWILKNCKVAKHNDEDVIVLNLDPNSPRKFWCIISVC